MSGFEIYTKKEKFAWDIACLDVGVTFIALTAIFVALFSVFTMPYHFSWILLLQGIAIPFAIILVWGRKYKLLRLMFVGGLGVGSYVYLKINAWNGILPCVNHAIRLVNKCYNINLNDLSRYGYAGYAASAQNDKLSFLWVLCVLELLFAVVLLKVLKTGRGRFGAIFVFLLPILMGIFCGKVPEAGVGCFLIVTVFLFVIVSYQRGEGIPVRALVSALILLLVVWMGSYVVESSMYDYKMEHKDEYQEMKLKLIEARQIDITKWIPEKIKFGEDKDKSEGNLDIIQMGVDWNSNFKELSHVNRTGEVIDEITVGWKPEKPVYWPMFEGYVYTGTEWAEDGAEGVYEQLIHMQEFCEDWKNYSTDRIASVIDLWYADGFRYTLNPGKMPEHIDFVEGFFFWKKEGFCVHFATAATIIYQMCDKKARYVEGYMIPASAFELQSDGKYKAVVTDYMAHAWCETYEQFAGWKVREHTLSSGLYNEELTPTPTKAPQVTTPTQAPPTHLPEQEPTVLPVEPQEQEKPLLPGDKDGSQYKVWDAVKTIVVYLTAIVTAIAGTFGLVHLQRQMRRKRKLRRFRSKNVKKAILAIYREIQELCHFAGLKDREPWRRENMAKIAQYFPQISLQDWEWIYDCTERTMFSNHLILTEEQKKMYDLYQQLRIGILQTVTRGRKLWFLYGRAW